jgi:hypothetical protein
VAIAIDELEGCYEEKSEGKRGARAIRGHVPAGDLVAPDPWVVGMADHSRHYPSYLLPSQPLSGLADQYKISTSIATESELRSFVVKVHGYSRLTGLLKTGECVASPPFNLEGHNWFLRYYPNGCSELCAAYVYLLLDSVDGKYVTAEASNIDVLGEYTDEIRLGYHV